MNLIQGQKPCARYRPLFDSYISNELLIETTHEILRHVEECSECTYDLEQRSRARDLLRRTMSGVQASPALRSRIQQSLRQSGTTASIVPRRPRPLLPQIAAGLAIAAFGAVLVQFLVRDPASLTALLNLGWGQHVACTLAGHYRETPPAREEMLNALGTDYASLLPVAESKLPEYRIRAAHICHSDGREFAHLILQKGSTMVSVSILKRQAGEQLQRDLLRSVNRGLHTAVRDRGEIVAFQTASHLVYVMGNQTSLEMQVVAQRIEPAIKALRP